MQQHEIHRFLERYFHANGCELKASGDGYMTVQLTIEMDKELMNRPFYWHYLEKTGGEPNPMALNLITDQEKAPEGLNGEVIHFGSPRLHQIFRSTRSLAGYTRLYEDRAGFGQQQIPLHPWLGMNVKISYQSNRKKDTFRSIGLNLINGMMKEGFHDELLTLKLTPKIPDLCFTLTPIIRPKSGIGRIQQQLRDEISRESTEWAESALASWKEDRELLDHFYKEVEDKPESYFLEQAALKDQYEPKIEIEIINGGIFYLQQ